MTDSPLPVAGEQAPGFSGRTHHGEVIELARLAGSPVLLMFYPFAFSRVCGSELQALMARQDAVRASGARVLAISCDPMHALRAYAQMLAADSTTDTTTDFAQIESRELPFDLVSDFWPHGEIAQRYGAFDATKGAALRRSFLLDPRLRVAHVQAVPAAESRDLDEALRLLGRLR
ncbi:redoxin domain-containing protein [Nesterenkonia sp. CF4.4]|uniref:redoxin domain-containing protein n=1 Tax=Nesterenkonia sp. CF4.4 TaxID=3373079 RepID=UPI003EE78BE0